MKICSTCQSSYPDGFKYCPQDNTTLLTSEEYARRSQPVTTPVVNPIVNETPRPEIARDAVPEVAVVTSAPKRVDEVNVPAPDAQPAAQYIAPRDLEYKASPVAPPTPAIEAPSVATVVEDATPAVPKAVPAAAANVATNGAAKLVPADDIGLNFALPEPGGLFSRLIASLQNIKDIKFTGGKLAPGATPDFQVLIPDESLFSRFLREVSLAWQDFRRNPKQFFVSLARGDGSNMRRRNMLLAGSEMAIIGYGTVYMCFHALALLGKEKPPMFNVVCIALSTYLVACYAVRGFLLSRLINKFSQGIALPKLGLELANWVPLVALLAFVFTSDRWFCQVFPNQCQVVQAKTEQFRMLEPTVATKEDPPKVEKKVEQPKEVNRGSKPKPQPARGGGGQNSNAPASKGVPPQMTMLPQVMPPTLRPPTIKNPSLVVAPTTIGDDKLSVAKAGPVGLENGADADPSLGRGRGTGIGDGRGAGQGPGENFNKGGGSGAIGGGDGGGIFQATANLRPQILYQEKAKYTEAARQNRVQGVVVVNVVFTADGRISNPRVVRGLPDGLNEQAILAAQRIKFRPAMKNGQPVSVRMSIEFTFNLL